MRQSVLDPYIGFCSLLAVVQRLLSTVHDIAAGCIRTTIGHRVRQRESQREREGGRKETERERVFYIGILEVTPLPYYATITKGKGFVGRQFRNCLTHFSC